MALENWTIISAGPSAARVTDNWILDGPVVAINRGLQMAVDQGVDVDVWACWDHPGNLLPDLLSPTYLINISSMWVGAPMWHKMHLEALSKLKPERAKEVLEWQKLVPAQAGFRCMNMGAIPIKDGARSAFCLLCACEKAVDLGAKHIRVLGADMNGGWVEDLTEDECRKLEFDRWAHEREAVSGMIAAAEKIGVEIELAHN